MIGIGAGATGRRQPVAVSPTSPHGPVAGYGAGIVEVGALDFGVSRFAPAPGG